MKSVVAFLALIVVTTAFKYQDEFDAWKAEFKKEYTTEKEHIYRQIVWESNKVYVDNHNENAKTFGFTLEMNEFADLGEVEFKRIYNGLLPRDSSYRSPALHLNTTEPAAATVDWRKKGYVTEVKNQGRCGSCWSFSTTGSLEGQHFKKAGRLVPLSEQQLMDCSTKFGNHGCKGGLMDNAFRYLATVKGDESEEMYPYKAEDSLYCKYEASEAVAGTKSHTDIPRGSETGLQNALESVGPISIAMDAGHKSFQLYKEGIYSDPDCSSTKLDHGVLAVGYGTNEMGEKYWIVKNSWGPAWGDRGYFEIAMANNECGICTQASYPTLVD